MNPTFTRLLILTCLAIALPGAMDAADNQPRMEKAVQLLQEAKTSATPAASMEKAKEHLQNATGNKGGNKVNAIKVLNQAIRTANKGGDPLPQIDEATQLIRAGIR